MTDMDIDPPGPSARRTRYDVTLDGSAVSQPWVEKYRPKTLDDVAAHKEIIDTSK